MTDAGDHVDAPPSTNDRPLERPWLTVVTVVKDDDTGLARTAASIVGQQRGFEYVVVDSSSDRNAVDRVLAALPELTATVHWVEPTGIYAAMNEGLRLSRGRYVYFANAGDTLADDMLAQVRAVVDDAAPTWMHGAVEIVGADGSRSITPAWDFTAEQAHAFSRGHFPCHQGMFVQAEVLRAQGGFDTSYLIAADYASFLQLARTDAPVVLDGIVATFTEGGTSTQRWHRAAKEFHHARRTILQPTGALARREQWNTWRGLAMAATYRSVWPIGLLMAALTWLLMALTGVDPVESARLVAIVTVQTIVGALWWRLLAPRRGRRPLELIGMGFALGSTASLLVGLLLGWPFAAWLPAVVIGGCTLVRRLRGRQLAMSLPWDRPSLGALGVGLAVGTVAFGYAVRAYPLTWTGIWGGYHGDMAFFEALSTSMAHFWPSSIFMAGAELRYHSLAYAWAGQVAATTDAAPFVVLTRLLPIAALIGVVALTAGWARRLSSNRWVPTLATLLVISGGFVGATYGTIMNFDSPSQSMSIVWLLALSLMLVPMLRGRRWMWQLLPLGLLVVALTGGKVSSAVIALAGLGVVAGGGVLTRKPWRMRAVVALVVAVVAAAGTYLVFLAGSANAGGLGLFGLLDRASTVQGLNPVATPRGVIAGIAILLLAVIPRWLGTLWQPARAWTQPNALYAIGLAGAGVATVIALSGGFNDLWFALAASAPLAVLSAAGLARAAGALGSGGHRFTRIALVLGLVIGVLAAAVWATGSTGIIGQGWRWGASFVGWAAAAAVGVLLARADRQRGDAKTVGRTAAALALGLIALVSATLPARFVYPIAEALAPKHETSLNPDLFSTEGPFVISRMQDRVPAWSDTQAAAGRWLDEHAGTDDLLATNVTYSAIVPALTGRQMYVSAIHYQAPYGRAADIPILLEREEQSWAFIDEPSAATAAVLCDAGVRWVWVRPDATAARDWRPFAEIAWQADDVIVLQLTSAACD